MRAFVLSAAIWAVALAASAAGPTIIEVPATAGSSDTFVVMVSGDGGWAAIDKTLAAEFARHGMPVAGLNSLAYFWTKRTPESASRDLESIIVGYSSKWRKSRVVLVGYSRGADVLPAMIGRLSADIQEKVRLVALLSPGTSAEFQFHVLDWMRDSKSGLAVRPELDRFRIRTLCIWGTDDDDSLCKGIALSNVKVIPLPGSHHFDGDYQAVAELVLQELR